MTNAPAAYKANYDRNRIREQTILGSLVDALESQRFSRLIGPGDGYKVDPHGGFISVFLPRVGITVWAAPMIDYNHVNRIDGSNIMIMFSVRDGYLTPDNRQRIEVAVKMAAGEWLSFQGVQGFEPPQANDWISGLDPTYQLWLSQRKPEMNILAWANAIKQVCAQLIKLRRLDDDGLEMGEPLLSKRIDVLDISRICHVCRHESHPQPALEWPATAAEGIETILDAAGSARYLYAEAEGFNSTWTLDSERGDVVILYETVPEIRRVRTD